MKYLHKWSIITLCLFVFGCNSETEQNNKKYIPHYDLRVENHSNIKIYPKIINRQLRRQSDFGVVSPDKSKTKGFGPLMLSDKITVIWEEGESTKKYESEIDSSKIFPIDKNVTRIVFMFKGKGNWIIKAIDREENVYSETLPGKLK